MTSNYVLLCFFLLFKFASDLNEENFEFMAFDPIIRKDQWLHLIYNVVRTWLVTVIRWRTKAREIRKLIL